MQQLLTGHHVLQLSSTASHEERNARALAKAPAELCNTLFFVRHAYLLEQWRNFKQKKAPL
jgi:hypothetical protein